MIDNKILYECVGHTRHETHGMMFEPIVRTQLATEEMIVRLNLREEKRMTEDPARIRIFYRKAKSGEGIFGKKEVMQKEFDDGLWNDSGYILVKRN